MINKKSKKPKYIIGIDEVGRGPLAGPVVVAALALPQNSCLSGRQAKLRIKNAELRTTEKSKNSEFLILHSKLAKLRDSKKLSPQQREKWFDWVKENKILYAVASVSPRIIDKINISNAANLAAQNALERLIKNAVPAGRQAKLRIKNCKVFLDGGLYLKRSKIQDLRFKTVIRGDEKIPAISLASIVAKVTRDKKMKEFHKKYPRYGFDKHKGYGTKYHIRAIKRNGVSKIHRKSFLKNF